MLNCWTPDNIALTNNLLHRTRNKSIKIQAICLKGNLLYYSSQKRTAVLWNISWPDKDGYQFVYSIHVPGWLQKWLNLITAPGSVSNEPGSVTWLATKYLKTVSWRNHTEKLTTWWPQNISFWPKINIPSSYFTILMLNCLENTLKLQFDSYVTAVRFLT